MQKKPTATKSGVRPSLPAQVAAHACRWLKMELRQMRMRGPWQPYAGPLLRWVPSSLELGRHQRAGGGEEVLRMQRREQVFPREACSQKGSCQISLPNPVSSKCFHSPCSLGGHQPRWVSLASRLLRLFQRHL